MPIQLVTKAKVRISIEDVPFAKGGEGEIHRIISPSSYSGSCVKIYIRRFQTRLRERKIAYMVSNAVHDANPKGNGSFNICYPVETVYRNDRFVGFIMPMAFDGSLQLYELCLPASKKLNAAWLSKYDRTSASGVESRLKLCVNVAAAIDIVHKTGRYVLVDLKPQNILITVDGKVSIVDLDSVQIVDVNRVTFPAQVSTAEYVPNEVNHLNPSKDMIPESWDRFSLAVVLYELLFGLHPYAASFGGHYQSSVTVADNIKNGLFVHGSKKTFVHKKPPPHDNFKNLPTSLQDLFIKAFDVGYGNPTLRPKANEWGQLAYFELTTNQNKIRGFSTVIKPKKSRPFQAKPVGTNPSNFATQPPQKTYVKSTIANPPPVIDSIPSILKVAAGIIGLVFFCMIASTIINFVRSLGQTSTSSTTPSTTSRPGPGATTQPTTNYTVNLPSTFSRKYTGTINGGNDFTLNLDKNGSKLEGKAETGKSWDKLSGTIDSDGSFEVEAYERGNKQKHTGNYRGTIYDRSINGTWSRPDGTGETSFDVTY